MKIWLYQTGLCVGNVMKNMCNTNSCVLYYVRSNASHSKWKPLIIDTCMVERVRMLHNQGIETSACCCGHSRILPNIIEVFRK